MTGKFETSICLANAAARRMQVRLTQWSDRLDSRHISVFVYDA